MCLFQKNAGQYQESIAELMTLNSNLKTELEQANKLAKQTPSASIGSSSPRPSWWELAGLVNYQKQFIAAGVESEQDLTLLAPQDLIGVGMSDEEANQVCAYVQVILKGALLKKSTVAEVQQALMTRVRDVIERDKS